MIIPFWGNLAVHQRQGDDSTALQTQDQPHSSFASELMKSPEFLNYIEHHGYHFSDKLANWATKQMTNANGETHNWTTSQVMENIDRTKGHVKPYVSNGDLAYAANMCYADFFPDVVKTESDCLRYAVKVGSDPDGYDGMIFSRWLSDVVQKEVSIKWGEMC